MHTLLLLSALFAPQEPTALAPETAPPPQPAIAWQRTLEDALAVSAATGRPLLICVNMDGEVFCDRFATQTYKGPEFVALTRGYVPLVVSPNRHTQTDYDHLGQRVPCSRFGTVTCGEHIYIESKLFERYFNGERSAPRHVGVSVDGKILFDRFLDRSMQTAIDAIGKHRVDGVDLPPTAGAADQLFDRRDAGARELLEMAYLTADASMKARLLAMAAKSTSEPIDVIRMGLLEADAKLYQAAVRALAATAAPDHRIDVEDALARVDDASQRTELTAAMRRLADADEDAARAFAKLTAAWQGIEKAQRGPWTAAIQRPAAHAEPIDPQALDRRLDELNTQLKATPEDGAARLALAQAQLDFAQTLIDQGRDPTFWLEDARRSAQRAREDNAPAGAALALEGYAAWLLSAPDAGEVAGKAIDALGEAKAVEAAASRLSARALEARGKTAIAAVYQAITEDPEAVPAELITAACGACEVLARHPWGTEQHVQDYVGFLEFVGARRAARKLLVAVTPRFAASPALHEKLRNRLLIDLGALGMRTRYQELVAASEADAIAATAWFAGYAAIVAAEVGMQQKRLGDARKAYDECVAMFGRSAEANPAYADSANHFAVLAHAGRAHLAFGAGEPARAVADLIAAVELRPASLEQQDGLERKPIGILRRIHRELIAAGDEERAGQLRAALENRAPQLVDQLK